MDNSFDMPQNNELY